MESQEGLSPSPYKLLERGTESHEKLYGQIAKEIANCMRFSKREFKTLKYKINADTATKNNPKKLGDVIFKAVRKLLGLQERQYRYKNKYGFAFDLRCFNIEVIFC